MLKMLRRGGFRGQQHRFSQFVCFPCNRLPPRVSERVAAWLEPLGSVPVIGRLGSQILMAAVREGPLPEGGGKCSPPVA